MISSRMAAMAVMLFLAYTLTFPSGTLPSCGDKCVPGAPSPGDAPLRRLSHEEYNNTVRDLLGDDSRPAEGFPADGHVTGFSNDAGALAVSSLLMERYLEAAEKLAANEYSCAKCGKNSASVSVPATTRRLQLTGL